jgi:hypothetical protein
MQVGEEETRKGPPAVGTRRGQPRSSRSAARGGTGPLPGGTGVRGPRGWSERAGL